MGQGVQHAGHSKGDRQHIYPCDHAANDRAFCRLFFRLAHRPQRYPHERNAGILFLVIVFFTGVARNHGLDTVARSQVRLPQQGLMSLGVISTPLFNIYSFWGIVWAHMGGTISIKVMLLAPAFRNLDSALEESSRISGASGW